MWCVLAGDVYLKCIQQSLKHYRLLPNISPLLFLDAQNSCCNGNLILHYWKQFP